MLACAIQWEWRGGLAAGLGEAALEFAVRPVRSDTTLANVFLLVLAGLIVGHVASLVRSSMRGRAEAAAIRAAAAERDRLSRAVHDGVLQTLAYVQRRGAEIGGPARELALLAGEQEAALRALVSGSGGSRPTAPRRPPRADSATSRRCCTCRRAVRSPWRRPACPFPCRRTRPRSLVAAVRAALDNTARHAGGASAYVLLENGGGGRGGQRR